MIDWPASLVGDIARRRAIIVLGSGVSRHSIGNGEARPPTWKGFLTKAIEDCPEQGDLAAARSALEAGDYLHACECLKKRFDEAWVPYLRATFSQPAFPPAEIHQKVLDLDCRIVFSLNFDDIYERHVSSIHRGSHIVKNYSDSDAAEFLRGNESYIIKVHGNLNSPDGLIFTQKDYSRARVKHNSFYQAFDAALLTHTFIFIGSGYSDPDINLLLENQNFGFPSQSPHYFLAAQGFEADRRVSLRENRNLKVLEYDAVDEFHSGLVTELGNLSEKVDAARYDIAQSASW